jgi:hypothetical protein
VSAVADYITPPEYAARLRVKPAKIIAAIRRGELAAIDMAEPGATRPRFRISPAAIEAFERRRAAGPMPSRIRRRRSPDIKSYV